MATEQTCFLLYKHALSRELYDFTPSSCRGWTIPTRFFVYAAHNPNATNSSLLSPGSLPTGGLGFLGLRQSRVTPLVFRVRLIAHVSLSLFLLLPWTLPVWSYSGLTELPAGVSSSAPTIYSQSGVSPQRLRGLALVRDTCSRTPIARCASVSQRRSW